MKKNGHQYLENFALSDGRTGWGEQVRSRDIAAACDKFFEKRNMNSKKFRFGEFKQKK